MLKRDTFRAAVAAALLAGLALAGSAAPASAQILVQKDLCGPAVGGPAACVLAGNAAPVVLPNTQVSYRITLSNPAGGQPASIDLGDNFPAGFTLLPPTICDDGTTLTGNSGPQMFFGPLAVAPGQTVVCDIAGYFDYLPGGTNNANNVVTVHASGQHEQTLVVSNPVNAVVAPHALVPSDIAVDKQAVVIDSGSGWTRVRYSITVANLGPNDVYGLQLQDRVTLPATSVPLTVTFQPGSASCAVVPLATPLPGGPATSDCFDPVPSPIHSPLFVPSTSPVDFVAWSYSGPGVLRALDTMVIEFEALVEVPVGMACQLVEGGNVLRNEAHIGFNQPGATSTTFEAAPGNNTATVDTAVDFVAPIDPNCGQPALQLTKTLDPASPPVFAWGDTVGYVITLHNASTQALGPIHLLDGGTGVLGDFVSGGIGTPGFEAQIVGLTCPQCTGTLPAGSGPVETVSGYLNPHWMAGTDVTATLAPDDGLPGGSDTISIQLWIRYDNPSCDSYPDITLKPVINHVVARYADPTLGGNDVTLRSNDAVALFADVPDCGFKVTKELANGDPEKIVFGQNVHYTVTYENPNDETFSIGTLIDAVRLVEPDYAWPLTVHYDYLCSASGGVTGFSTGGSPFPAVQSASGTVQMVPTTLPQQGVRILQNAAPVVFPGHSSVTCQVRLLVDPPADGAPYCARTGRLENAAIMDQSAFYNANLPWSSTPGYFDTVSLPLPQCFDLVLNKAVGTLPGPSGASWTTPGGGPLFYDVKLFNPGDAIVPADDVAVSDNFSTPMPALLASVAQEQCSAGGSPQASPALGCELHWAPPPTTANPSSYDLVTLPSGATAHGQFQLPGPYPAAPNLICNDARATLAGAKADDPASHADWYARDPATWQTNRCVGIFERSEINVVKIVDVAPNTPPPPPTSFVVDVHCAYSFGTTPANTVSANSSQVLTLNWPSAAIGVAQPIPLNSACSIVERPLADPYVASKGCRSGWARWSAEIGYPESTTTAPALPGLVTHDATQSYTIHNRFECAPLEPLAIVKKLSNPQNLPLTGALFPITVACTGSPPIQFNILDGQEVDLTSMAPGADCQVTENTAQIVLPGEKPVCPNGSSPVWTVAIDPPGPVHHGDFVVVANEVSCKGDARGQLFLLKTLESGSGVDAGHLAFPVSVSCNGVTTSTLLSPGQPAVLAGTYADGTLCHLEEALDAIDTTKLCPPGAVAQWAEPSYQSLLSGSAQDVVIAGATIVAVRNAVRCVEQAVATVGKKVVNNTLLPPGVVAGWSFPIHVFCEDGTDLTLTLADGQSGQVTLLSPQTTCKVEEDPTQLPVPPSERTCPPGLVPQWSQQREGSGDYLLPGGQMIIINVLDCGKPAERLGSVTVWKHVANQTLFPLTGWQFPMTVTCGGTTTSLSLTDGGSGTVGNIPIGTSCTVAETLPLALPPIVGNQCFAAGLVPQWTSPVAYFPGQTVTISATTPPVYVLNTLTCVPRTGTGSVVVTKLVDDLTNGSAPAISFPITVSCGGVPVQTVSLAAGGSTIVGGLPLGSTCVVSEDPPATAASKTCPEGGSWTASIAAPGQGFALQTAGQAQAVVVTNTFDCQPPPPGSGLSVTKICGPAVPTAVGNEVVADCQIIVTATAPVPATISVIDTLMGPINVPGAENQIVSMSSSENWSCPPMPVFAGTEAECQLSGADLVAAGGQSVIDVVVQFHDAGNATEAPNCVEAIGYDAGGTPIATALQACAGFTRAGLIACDPGLLRSGNACVPPMVFDLTVTQPQPCVAGRDCRVVIALSGSGQPDYDGPLFVSSSLPIAVAANGGRIGDWFCANADLGGLCSTMLTGLPSGIAIGLDLPIRLPRDARSAVRACFAVETPSAVDSRGLARSVQLGLAEQGSELGTIDGVIGPRSGAAIATFARRTGSPLTPSRLDEVYHLLFGAELPQSRDQASQAPACIMLRLAQPERQVVRDDVKVDDPVKDDPREPREPERLVCSPPFVPDRRGTQCVCPDNTVPLGGTCVGRDFPVDLPRQVLPEGFGIFGR